MADAVACGRRRTHRACSVPAAGPNSTPRLGLEQEAGREGREGEAERSRRERCQGCNPFRVVSGFPWRTSRPALCHGMPGDSRRHHGHGRQATMAHQKLLSFATFLLLLRVLLVLLFAKEYPATVVAITDMGARRRWQFRNGSPSRPCCSFFASCSSPGLPSGSRRHHGHERGSPAG